MIHNKIVQKQQRHNYEIHKLSEVALSFCNSELYALIKATFFSPICVYYEFYVSAHAKVKQKISPQSVDLFLKLILDWTKNGIYKICSGLNETAQGAGEQTMLITQATFNKMWLGKCLTWSLVGFQFISFQERK